MQNLCWFKNWAWRLAPGLLKKVEIGFLLHPYVRTAACERLDFSLLSHGFSHTILSVVINSLTHTFGCSLYLCPVFYIFLDVWSSFQNSYRNLFAIYMRAPCIQCERKNASSYHNSSFFVIADFCSTSWQCWFIFLLQQLLDVRRQYSSILNQASHLSHFN